MNTKSFLTLAVACFLSLLPISPARGQGFEISAISKAGAAPGPYDITIVWTAVGTPPHYTVEHTADLTAPGPWTAVTPTIPPTTTNWTDSGAVPGPGTPEAKRFYRVWGGDPGDGDPTSPVGFVKVQNTGFTMMSVPLRWDPPGGTRDMSLGGPIGDTIEEGATVVFLFKWNGVTQDYEFSIFMLGTWTAPAMTVDLGEGFWLHRSASTTEIVFLGWVPTDGAVPVTLYRSLTMFNWPYPTELKLNDPTCALAVVGHGGSGTGAADMVYEWDPVTFIYTSAWLVGGLGPPHDGKWWDDKTGSYSALGFKPGGAMWYYRRPATGAVWLCTRPYSL